MISVIVPAYNEEAVIESFLREFKRDIGLKNYELLLVNDGSTDRTEEIVRRFQKQLPPLCLISYSPNRGFGYALKKGFAQARGEVIVTMDSDLSHPPKMIKSMVADLNGWDAIIGSRYIGVKREPYRRYLLSKVTNIVTRAVVMIPLKDVTSGFRAYNARHLKDMMLMEKGFEVQIEILVKLLKKHSRVKEIPLPLIERREGRSKFVIWKHGPRYCLSLLKIFFYRWL